MPSMVSSEATNPPTLTMPLAVPSRDTGANVRARSKPIIDPGPPRPVVTTSVQSSHSGASPGQSRVTVQAVIIAGTVPGPVRGPPPRVRGDGAADQRAADDEDADQQRQ